MPSTLFRYFALSDLCPKVLFYSGFNFYNYYSVKTLLMLPKEQF
jgi:hypothetical protein